MPGSDLNSIKHYNRPYSLSYAYVSLSLMLVLDIVRRVCLCIFRGDNKLYKVKMKQVLQSRFSSKDEIMSN